MADEINKRQYELLDELVKTPSWFSPRGGNDENLILDKIEDMLAQRTDAEMHRVSGSTVGESLDPFGRKSVFAERGTLKDAEFTVLLYAHIDTVYPDGFPKEWPNPLQLIRDGDRLSGLGAYDMKAGAMEVIDVFREIDVPKGLRLQVALCHDEEMQSYGALDLVEWMKSSGRTPDLVISPEIATLTNRQETDGPVKDVIVNRIGHVKSLCKLIVPQAHRFDRSALDAETEYSYLRNHFDAYFLKDRKIHKFFGKNGEDLKIGEVHVPRATSSFSNTTSAMFRMSYLNVPGHSIREVLEWEKRKIQDVAKIRQWTRKGAEIVFEPTPNETSYEPYALDLRSPTAKMVLQGVEEVYGGYKPKAGGSTSDANVFNAALDAPCFDIGPIGGRAHNREEWVSNQSIARNIAWMHHLIGRSIPDGLSKA